MRMTVVVILMMRRRETVGKAKKAYRRQRQ